MGEIEKLVEELENQLKINPEIVNEIESVVKVSLKDTKEEYILFLKGKNPYVTQEKINNVDCLIQIDTKDFIKLANNKLNTTMAYMTGKLKVKGNIAIALKLQEILQKYNAN
ncbi:SCP2 sterol-binding domain-containing protein [Oceanobacillus kimchii]|uniref:SCP2 sterol-binding domain-containing protein n=1 Tax=Oceanobacillus kimchii TaxID=746691 RepID=UPI00034909D2|nr:SCP2 sterol-binding domain-containing protein [Oceanobacillus kimchii]MCT1575893.1 SCP2 sterol-binding domain-containing protein [Oceanobacillus kimchii]MCT2135530.1 SCP2 sterol-binding domain-containing protein [Oceanobacillus kimchii]